MRRQLKILLGRGISPGVASGRAFLCRDVLYEDVEPYNIARNTSGDEYARVEQAREQVLQELDNTAKRVESDLDEERADIFRAQAQILRSPELMEEIRENLERDLTSAGRTVRHVLARFESHFEQADDPIFRSRVDDIADITRRLLRVLSGSPWHSLADLPPETVVVAARLLPSDTITLSRRSTVGVVVERGGPLSHTALLTRAMGIPAVAEIPDLLKRVPPGALLLIDGLAGKVVFDPDKVELTAFEKRRHQYQLSVSEMHRRRYEPAQTRDGLIVQVLANIATQEDAIVAADSGAEGVGLCRIEGLYLSRQMPPTEEELTRNLWDVLGPVRHQPVTVRLLDVGGDKRPVFLDLPAQPDAFLSRRGVRLLLDYPDLLATQLRVLLRLSQELELRISIPMVTLLEEFQQVRQALHTTAKALGIRAMPPLGVMIETPAAALCAAEFARAADFVSLGTNDLTQYTLVAGREEASVRDCDSEDHPAVQRLIARVVRAAKRSSKPPILCGELAHRTNRLPWLLQIGIRTLSVAPSLVPSVKASLRSIDLSSYRRSHR